MNVDHSQSIGGDTAKLLGGYIPPSPLVSASLVIASSKPTLRLIAKRKWEVSSLNHIRDPLMKKFLLL